MTISLFATQSLRAIDDWLTVANSNLVGATRTSFKETDIMFGGGVTYVDRQPLMFKSGRMLAEQALTTDNTRINWKQGDIVGSTQETHFAVQGQGFFLLVDPLIRTAYNGSAANFTDINGVTTTPTAPNAPGVYLSRDGEFHWAIVKNAAGNNITGVPDELVMVDKNGLLVMADMDLNTPGTLYDPADPTKSDNRYTYITKSNFDNTMPDPGILNQGIRMRPSVVIPSSDPPGTGAHNTVIDFERLKFSKFGSTVYEPITATSIKTLVNGSGGNNDRRTIGRPGDPFIPVAPVAPGPSSGSNLVEQGLESSNTDVAANMTEMAVLGKVYNGFVQLIKAYNSSLDEVLGFIR